MSTADFVKRFGGIYEHSPWVAERAAPFVGASADFDQIAELMADCVDNASHDQQLALIRAHPELAGKTQIANKLTEHSSAEQASAGLDQCSEEEFQRFQSFNERYKEKFDFPFVMAVRDSSRAAILEEFERRLENDYAMEFETAIVEVHKIARLRLEAIGLQQ